MRSYVPLAKPGVVCLSHTVVSHAVWLKVYGATILLLHGDCNRLRIDDGLVYIQAKVDCEWMDEICLNNSSGTEIHPDGLHHTVVYQSDYKKLQETNVTLGPHIYVVRDGPSVVVTMDS